MRSHWVEVTLRAPSTPSSLSSCSTLAKGSLRMGSRWSSGSKTREREHRRSRPRTPAPPDMSSLPGGGMQKATQSQM